MQTIKKNHSHDIQINSPHCGRSYFVSSYAFILDSVCKAVKKTCVFCLCTWTLLSISRCRHQGVAVGRRRRRLLCVQCILAPYKSHPSPPFPYIYTAHCNLYAFFRIHCWFLVEKGNLCYPRTRVLLFVQREFFGLQKKRVRWFYRDFVVMYYWPLYEHNSRASVFFLVLGCIQQCAQRTCIFQLLLSESRWLASTNFHCFTPKKNATAHTRQSHNVKIVSTVRMAVRKSCRNFIMCVWQGIMYAALFWCKQWKAKIRYAVWYIRRVTTRLRFSTT